MLERDWILFVSFSFVASIITVCLCVRLVNAALPPLRQMLSRLLNSSHPEDLKAANKLIKEMVQEVKLCAVAQSFHQSTLSSRGNGLLCSQDQKRTEKVTKRVNTIQEVKESVALLTQLLQGYDDTATSQSNAELIQVKRKAQSFPLMGQRRGERSVIAVCVLRTCTSAVRR